MARWIHEFRSTGERAMTEEERRRVRRRAARLGLERWVWGVVSVFGFLGSLGCLIVAAGGPVWAWPLLIPCLILGFYALSWANAAEKLALLHRRALRVGTIEEFRRVPGDDTVRRLWQEVGYKPSGEEDEEENVTPHLGSYWSIHEEFEETLVRSAPGLVDRFESVGRDGAVIFVEGRLVYKLLEPSVWEVVS